MSFGHGPIARASKIASCWNAPRQTAASYLHQHVSIVTKDVIEMIPTVEPPL